MKRALFLLSLFAIFTTSALATDYTVTATSVLASSGSSTERDTDHVPAPGVTVAAGQPVYLDATTNAWKLALSSSTRAAAAVYGIALNGAGPGQPVAVVRKDDSFTPGFTIAAGEMVILSATAGKLAPAADLASTNYATFVMIGIGGNKAKLRPLVTGAQKP